MAADERRAGEGSVGATAEVVRRHFDREAVGYERGRRYRRLERPRSEAAALLGLTPSDRLLDVGCGTGITLRSLAARAHRAVGIDISPSMIAYAREQARDVCNLEFVVAESSELPFPDASFTVVFCTFSFHHYPRPAASLHEMARVLVDGGRVVIADASSDYLAVKVADFLARRREPGHVRFYRSHELVSLLEAAGFVDVSVRRSPRSWYAIATGTKTIA